MRTKILIGALALLGAIAFVVPAGAVTINGVDYALFARCKIGMENGPVKIDGNIAVNEICGAQNGFLHLGINNVVNGTATANNMFFGGGAKVTKCEFNNSTGGDPNTVCGTQAPAVLPITTWASQPNNPGGIPLPIPTVTVGANNVLCPPDCSPAPGDYRDIRVKDNATLTLAAGTYNARNVLVEFNATLTGAGSTSTALNLTGTFGTEPGANINGVTITSVNGQNQGGLGTTAEVIETGNLTTVNDAVFYAPFGRMHLHQGGTFLNFEGIAVLITVEPVTITRPEGRCACIGAVADGGQTIDLSQGCHLNDPTIEFFVSTTCAIDAFASCPGANCIAATAQAGATDTTATLTKPAAPAGNYHVIVRSAGGAFCTVQTVPIP